MVKWQPRVRNRRGSQEMDESSSIIYVMDIKTHYMHQIKKRVLVLFNILDGIFNLHALSVMEAIIRWLAGVGLSQFSIFALHM